MALNLSPRTSGGLGVVFGLFCVGMTIYWARTEGTIYLALCLLGPAVLPLSFALIVLPIEKLIKPSELNGKMVYDTSNPQYTPLSVGFLVLGFIGSGVLYLLLKYGL